MPEPSENSGLRRLEWETLRSEISRKQDFCERIKLVIVGSTLAIYAFAIENKSWTNGWVHSVIVFGGLPLLIGSLGYYWILTHRFSVVRIALFFRTRQESEPNTEKQSDPKSSNWEQFLRSDNPALRQAASGELPTGERAPQYISWLPKTRSDEIICGSLCVFAVVAAIFIGHWSFYSGSSSAEQSSIAPTRAKSNPTAGVESDVTAPSVQIHPTALLPFPFALAFIFLHCIRIRWQIKTVDEAAVPKMQSGTPVLPEKEQANIAVKEA